MFRSLSHHGPAISVLVATTTAGDDLTSREIKLVSVVTKTAGNVPRSPQKTCGFITAATTGDGPTQVKKSSFFCHHKDVLKTQHNTAPKQLEMVRLPVYKSRC